MAAACVLGYPPTPYHFPEAGVLPGNLPEPLTPPPPPSERRAAVCLHLNLDVCIILNLGLLIICIWILSKKLSNADVLISALAWGRNTKFADFHCLLKQWPVRNSQELQSRSHRRGLTYQSYATPSCMSFSPWVTVAHFPAVEISLISRANLGKASSD